MTASETGGEPNRDHCRSYDQTVGSKGNERREEIAMEASEGQGAVWTGDPRRLFGAKAPPRAGKTVGIVLWDCRCPGARRKSQGLLVHATSRAGNAAGNRVAPTLGEQPHSVKRWVICSQNGGVAPLSTCIRVSPTNDDRIMPFIFVMVGCERSAPAPPAGNEDEWSWQLSVSLSSMFANGGRPSKLSQECGTFVGDGLVVVGTSSKEHLGVWGAASYWHGNPDFGKACR